MDLEEHGGGGGHVNFERKKRQNSGPRWKSVVRNAIKPEKHRGNPHAQLASLAVARCFGVFTRIIITHPIPPADSWLLDPQILLAPSLVPPHLPFPQVPGREQMLYMARCCLPDLCLGGHTIRRPQAEWLPRREPVGH